MQSRNRYFINSPMIYKSLKVYKSHKRKLLKHGCGKVDVRGKLS